MAGKHARPCLTGGCNNHVSYRRAVAGAKHCGPCSRKEDTVKKRRVQGASR